MKCIPEKRSDAYPSMVAAMKGTLTLLHIFHYRSMLCLVSQDLQKLELKLSFDIKIKPKPPLLNRYVEVIVTISRGIHNHVMKEIIEVLIDKERSWKSCVESVW